jgi:hypothetical protein
LYGDIFCLLEFALLIEKYVMLYQHSPFFAQTFISSTVQAGTTLRSGFHRIRLQGCLASIYITT